jgi:hypothetical protein
MKKKMLRPLNNWKKDKIYFPFYHQGEVYRTGIPDEKNSFHHSIQYGPQFINNSTDSDRKIQIQEMKNMLSSDLNLNVFLNLDDGKIFLEKLKEVMKDVHFHFSKTIEDDKTKLELQIFQINLTILDILLGLVPKSVVDEKIINHFISICENKNLSVFNEEQKYKEIQKIYTIAYESSIREYFQILLNENQIEEKHLDKVELFLSLLIKCSYKLFDYICEKTLEEFKEDIRNEWINIYTSFYLYQSCENKYNILIIDATTKKLFNEIDQRKFIDNNKKCAVLLYFPDYRFEPITIEVKDEKEPYFSDYSLNEDIEYTISKRKEKTFHIVKYFFFNLDHPFIESILNGK